MAVWKKKVAGCQIRILNVDHPPPHCHAMVDGKDLRVNLIDFEVMNPPPHELPPNLRRSLAKLQETLLESWEDVTVIPPGAGPGW